MLPLLRRLLLCLPRDHQTAYFCRWRYNPACQPLHNCRGCYYACQYTEPHEFAINMPRALAEVRAKSWERFAWPGFLADRFQRRALPSVALIIGFTALFWAGQALKPDTGEGFYAVMSHSVMISIFTPAFLIPLLAFVGLRSIGRG